MNEPSLIARSAFANAISIRSGGKNIGSNGRVVASDLDGLDLAAIIVKKNCAKSLAARLRERLAIDLPF